MPVHIHNHDPDEIQKFEAIAHRWWDLAGPMKMLHRINALRLKWIEQHTPLAFQKILDVGCGGGILSESLARQHAEVIGIDLAVKAIQIAKLHSLHHQLNIDYQLTDIQSASDRYPAYFDIVTCFELLEHVPHPQDIVTCCAKALKPGGLAFFSTLNRNLKSYITAILGAEYLLHWIPIGTHDYAKFIKPSTLAHWIREIHLQWVDLQGIRFSLLKQDFILTQDVSVNYMICVQKAT
jgi:2-polyprenyl-6-hydroxyphenyl methylase/3-demethylubiquinone-9 3-methyltransferase